MEAQTNKIDIAGRISGEITPSHEVFGEKFFSSVIEIKRLSESSDFIPITLSEKLIMKHDIKPGSFIRAEGQLRSYNYYLKINDLTENRRSKLVITAFLKEIFPFETYLNDVHLDGFICKPPVYRQTPFGKQISDLLVAVNRNYGKSDYIPVIFWGSNAAKTSSLPVGSHISVIGRVQSRDYEKKLPTGEVVTKTTYEVSGFKVGVEN